MIKPDEAPAKWRTIGGGIWDGEDVTVEINDSTGEIQMIYWGSKWVK